MESRTRYCIEHHILGRLCGLLWDFAVTTVTVVLIPLACLSSSVSIVQTNSALAVCTLPLAFVAIVSFLVGFVWNFRRHMPEG